MERLFVVTTAHGPAWDAARPVERQAAWEAHADFMNALEAEGFVLLGGTLDDAAGTGGNGAMLVVRARDAEDVRWRLAADPWAKAGLLAVASVRAWTLRLGEDFEADWVPARARASARAAAKSQGKPRPVARKAKKSQGGRAPKAKESQGGGAEKAKESQQKPSKAKAAATVPRAAASLRPSGRRRGRADVGAR
jgi:uncharacterized protein YciI